MVLQEAGFEITFEVEENKGFGRAEMTSGWFGQIPA